MRVNLSKCTGDRTCNACDYHRELGARTWHKHRKELTPLRVELNAGTLNRWYGALIPA